MTDVTEPTELESLQRELRGTQEMLAHVLVAHGAPVVVSKADLQKGLPEGLQIKIDDSPEGFIFSLDLPDGQ